MGEIGDLFNAYKEHKKELNQKRADLYIPKIEKLGAVKKSDGVYELNNWLLYPTKGFAMDKRNNKKRMNLGKFINTERGIL